MLHTDLNFDNMLVSDFQLLIIQFLFSFPFVIAIKNLGVGKGIGLLSYDLYHIFNIKVSIKNNSKTLALARN